MAQRLATEYVKACLQLTAQEMAKFVRFMGDQNVRMKVRVLENGNHELALVDEAASEEIRLTFERHEELFVCVLSCRLVHQKLTNAMRKAVSTFRGDAIVNRIYPNYTMVYHYKKGAVQKIEEHAAGETRTVFELKDTLGQLERVFHNRQIEFEIERIQSAINELLDLRNQSKNPAEISDIDARLKQHTQKLFILEAP
ncbi:non-ribosomal peptide synthetase module [Paenibacillus tarimensis]|uniref:non-ribosomal peptide synthetase module n=1 Tax=Paenibacillus tarimensis TaxID=416012 RepID=UPI001F1D2609|nr:non-ribosomal peptide synthetase module [Paenibacillus tarimensis]MCF2943931.1 non-ribosomal peptide synthetase module [Paenibacillus tarimensis]